MFVTYPIAAVEINWIHDSLVSALEVIIQKINLDEEYPVWPGVLPEAHSESLRRKTKIKRLLEEFYGEATKVSIEVRAHFLTVLVAQNNIAGLLDGSAEIPTVQDAAGAIYEKSAEIFEEGFALLSKTKTRDRHYKIIYESLQNKTCPFCGYESLDAPGLSREDEDHYLPRSKYHLAAANLNNLVPMGGRCNGSYKLRQDLVEDYGNRRKAINPYGSIVADIDLRESNLVSDNLEPDWSIELIPDIEECQTWERVFSVRNRLTESVLKPSYPRVLDEISDWFKVVNLFEGASNDEVLDRLERFAQYKRVNREDGLGFLKHKVVETISHHYREGSGPIIAMIRNALSPAPCG